MWRERELNSHMSDYEPASAPLLTVPRRSPGTSGRGRIRSKNLRAFQCPGGVRSLLHLAGTGCQTYLLRLRGRTSRRSWFWLHPVVANPTRGLPCYSTGMQVAATTGRWSGAAVTGVYGLYRSSVVGLPALPCTSRSHQRPVRHRTRGVMRDTSRVVEMRGLEPLTPAMRTRCSPS